MRILVTRPKDDAEETAERLIEMGHEPIIAPLLEIRLHAGPEIALDGVQAVLVTSANGIRALAQRTPRRDIRILAVGEQSAATAEAFGFRCVEHSGGDADALAGLASSRLSLTGGLLLHASGAETRGSLKEKLTAYGFTVSIAVLYDAVAVAALPEAATRALGDASLDEALFFSPRTAAVFAALVGRAGLAGACHRTIALCLSVAVAKALKGLEFRDVRIAARPDQTVLLDLVGGH